MLEMPVEFEQPKPLPTIEVQYLKLLHHIIQNGTESGDRTEVGTKKVFGEILKANLEDGFPLLTTKKIGFETIKNELLWFISGETNIKPLVDKNVHIWDEWPFQHYLKENGLDTKYLKYTPEWEERKTAFIETIKNDSKFAKQWGDLGPVYGYQWRHWQNPDGTETDQLKNTVDQIINNPDSRRIIVSAWNPSDIDKMSISGLPPCHMLFQFQVDKDKLNLVMYQRSVDSFLGLPFNIASYALLNHIVANITGKTAGNLTLLLGDTHIYLNHQEQIKMQLSRDPLSLPRLTINGQINSIDTIDPTIIKLEGYNPHPSIKAPIAV